MEIPQSNSIFVGKLLSRNFLSIASPQFTSKLFSFPSSLPEKLKPESRKKFEAYDGINNTFNSAFEVLSGKVHRALIKAKLEPYLGFLYSVQFGKPSLVCDLQELYRYLIDDFLIQFCQNLRRRNFTVKTERLSRSKKGKREYLNGAQTSALMKRLTQYFEGKVEVPRIRHGHRQTLETLINEEALLLAKYLRDEGKTWIHRIAISLNN